MAHSLTHAAVVGTNNPASRLSDTDLLRELGIRSLQRLAGYIPPMSDAGLPKLAPSIKEQICEQSTVVQFFRLHNSPRIHLKSIWMERFTNSGQKFPNEFLPDLLGRLSDIPRFRNGNTKYLPLMSERVCWLVQFSEYDDWKWILRNFNKFEHEIQEEEENPVDWFIELRKMNPALGIQWLSENWPEIRADLQVQYLDTLFIGLNPADETFLSQLLHAENSFDLIKICDKAAYLLSLLEADSIQEIIEEIIDMTFVAETRQDGWVLDFRWSDVFFEHPAYAPKEGLWLPIAQKYNWSGNLSQLLQTVPLEYWCQHYCLEPIELVAAIYNGLNGREFSEAWWARLIHESREDFLRALLANKVTGFWFKPWDYSRQLIEGLPFELFQIVVDEWLSNA